MWLALYKGAYVSVLGTQDWSGCRAASPVEPTSDRGSMILRGMPLGGHDLYPLSVPLVIRCEIVPSLMLTTS